MTKSILVALNDSMSSRAVMDYLVDLASCPEDWEITLLHLFRQPPASEELMGKKFASELPGRYRSLLEAAREKLVFHGFLHEKIHLELVEEPYPTIAEGIIDQVQKGDYDMVVIGRKKMSKAEEFVRGDVSVKLIRAIAGAGILVVTAE